ncbi:MAG: hypothetical protein ACM3X6_07830 [Patescibacteria group bacterium]
MVEVIARAEQYLRSRFYEQLVEHVFISEVLQEAWFRFGKTVEVLRSEIDTAGYDVVLECNGVVRHVQLKTSTEDARTARQLVNIALADKPSGCVVWLVRTEHSQSCRMQLRYRFFGNGPGEPLPSLEAFPVAKHTKADSKGVKTERPAIRQVPKSQFEELGSATELLGRLFGLGQYEFAAAAGPVRVWGHRWASSARHGG